MIKAQKPNNESRESKAANYIIRVGKLAGNAVNTTNEVSQSLDQLPPKHSTGIMKTPKERNEN
jgi:hypothetical protein